MTQLKIELLAKGIIMVELGNSEVLRHVLQKLINISGRKTTEGHAVFTISKLIGNLKEKYDFLKHVEIKDTRYVELEEPISVMSEINNVQSEYVGKALYDIIASMNAELGREAGHFFIKELRRNIDEKYESYIEDMGLDLGLMQLEFEVSQMVKKLK